MTITCTTPVNTTVQGILGEYKSILAEADRLFQDYVHTHSLKITCGPACSECCPYYIFVHFIEAYYLWMGMQALEPQTRHAIRLRAMRNIPKIEKLERFARVIKERSGEVVQDAKAHLRSLLRREVRCPFVGEQGGCLVYEHRLLIDRLFGIPLRVWEDARDFPVCEKNTQSPPELPPGRPTVLPTLDVLKLQKKVAELSRALEILLTGQTYPRYPILLAALFPLEKFIEGSKAIKEKELSLGKQEFKACSEQGRGPELTSGGGGESIRQRLLKLGIYSAPAIATIQTTEEAYR
ncbi:MAG TPA: hypothetical protein ACFYD1_04820 [Candidatus Hypogeohydataceae bacterium YC38]